MNHGSSADLFRASRVPALQPAHEVREMIFRGKDAIVHRPKITPDPSQVAALQRRFEELSYQPQNGFHRDLRQGRQPPRQRG
jgi:hypothetical protein